MEILKVKNLTFTYPEQGEAVLDSLNLSVQQGELVVLFGETGTGKSTLLKLLKPDLAPHGDKTGTIYYKGEKIEQLSERSMASNLGFVMQNPEQQIVTDKVWHELAFGLENLGEDSTIIRRRVGETANFFGIHNWFHKKTTDLSGGQKQLLNLASIMVMEPEVLILDEPTSQLDPIAATNFINILEKLNRDLGLTIIIVEHRLEEVLPIASHVALIEKGMILHKEKPRNIGHKLMKMKGNGEHPLIKALPTTMQIYHALGNDGESPLTVREGRNFLSTHYHQNLNESETLLPHPKRNGEVVIELKKAWFRYERDLPDVLADVNLKIYQGEIFSVLGGNASGKTTLLNVMSGQNRPYRGSVFIKGKNIKSYKKSKLYSQNLAVLPQDPQTVFIKSNLREDYKEIAKAHRYEKDEINQLIEQVTEELTITHLLDKHPYDLSGGEQQKAALGKILLLKPEILLLDEPTKGLDAHSKHMLSMILKKLIHNGLTLVLVTHDIEFAALVSSRVGLYFDNEIISIDPPIDFFSSNHYYTTTASRMSRHIFKNTITHQDVITLCQRQKELNCEKVVE